MLEYYSIKQLLSLRSICADTVERADEIEDRANALLMLEQLDEELSAREQKKSA